jgi:signal transduction histidine kinase
LQPVHAEPDADIFNARVSVATDNQYFILRFLDWGIGVKQGLEDKIFDEGFRAPEAIGSNVTGTGLGLTIARKIIRELGGDLTLVRRYKPTEFQLLLPKKLQGEPK